MLRLQDKATICWLNSEKKITTEMRNKVASEMDLRSLKLADVCNNRRKEN